MNMLKTFNGALAGALTRWTPAAFAMACVLLSLPHPARGDEKAASCEEKILAKVATTDSPGAVLFNAETRQLVRAKGCKDGACPHVFFASAADKLPSKPGAYFASAVKDDTLTCENKTWHYRVLEPKPASVAGACTKVVNADTAAKGYVLHIGDNAPRLLKLGCDAKEAECSIANLANEGAKIEGYNKGSKTKAFSACGTDKIVMGNLPTSTSPETVKVGDETGTNGGETVKIGNETSPFKVVEAWRTGQIKSPVKDRGPNVVTPQGAEIAGIDAAAVATEAIQILGQIVVDRASDAAYRQIQKQVSEFLKCPEVPQNMTDTRFPRTCRILATVRVQDLASSRVALVVAVASDALAELARQLPDKPGGLAIERALKLLVSDTLIAQLAAMQQGHASSTADGLAAVISESALEALGEDENGAAVCTEERRQVIAVAGSAVVQCRVALRTGELANLATCPVEDFASQLAQGLKTACKDKPRKQALSPEGIALARLIALNLLKAQTATIEDKADVRGRVKYAIDAAFDASCLFFGSTDKLARCTADLEPTSAIKEIKLASVVRALVVAVVDGETNTVIGAASKGVSLLIADSDAWWPAMKDEDAKKKLQRALRLVGGILQYAETYTVAEKEKDKEAQHAARTKILESLTREMTNRQGREQDNIWSLGGSLRLTGGARLDFAGKNDPTLWGPLTLPMGFGYQRGRLKREDWGFHMELSIIDLGQYVSFQDGDTGLQVREPEPEDLLSPSVTLGAYLGTEVPFFIGVTAGYSPSFEFKQDVTRPVGAFNLGFAVGAYVPLFDLN